MSERIRPWEPGDRPGVDALLGPDADAIWVEQGHPMHGEPSDGERWKRTLVAEADGTVTGAVTVARNKWHPGRYTLALEVAAPYRRAGVGTRLLAAARALRPEPLGFLAKLMADDTAGLAMLRSVGGQVLVTSPCPRPDVRSAAVAGWIADRPAPPGVRLAPLTAVLAERWPVLFASLYAWTHADWLPTDPATLPELADHLTAAVDGELSVAAWREDRVAAVAFALREGPQVVVGVETVERATPDGEAIVAATLAECLLGLAAAGAADVLLDGHLSDDHLAPVLTSLPPEVPRSVLHGIAIP